MKRREFLDDDIVWPDDQDRRRTATRPKRPYGPVVFLLLLLLLALLLWRYSPDKPKPNFDADGSGRPTHVFYYNEQTGAVNRYALDEQPPGAQPQAGPSAPPAAEVRAHMFRRGFGVDAGEPFVAYLEKPAPGVSQAACEASKRNYGADWGRGILVRRPTDESWVPADSPEGRAIIIEAYGTEEKCQQGRMVYSR